MSTTPDSRPSIGAEPRIIYAWMVAVPELGQIVDGVQAGPLVGQVRVQVVLHAIEGDRGAGERQPLAVLPVDVARHEIAFSETP